MRGGGHNLGWKPVSAMRTSSPIPSKRFKEIVGYIEIIVYLDNLEILYPLKKIPPLWGKDKTNEKDTCCNTDDGFVLC